MACFNASDFFAYLSFFTERALVEVLGLDVTTEDLAAMPGPTAEPPQARGMVLDVREVTLLPDGQVGALVDVFFSDEDGVLTNDWIFVREGEQWKFDDSVTDLGEQYPPEVTPAA